MVETAEFHILRSTWLREEEASYVKRRARARWFDYAVRKVELSNCILQIHEVGAAVQTEM